MHLYSIPKHLQRSNLGNFGQLLAVANIALAAANVGIQAEGVSELQKLAQALQAKLDSDADQINYITDITVLVQSAANLLANTGRFQPGTSNFDKALALLLQSILNYRPLQPSGCDADIYFPNQPGNIWASIDNNGSIQQPTMLPPDVGVIWATKCKDAIDQAKISYFNFSKGQTQFDVLKAKLTDIGTLGLFLKFGVGLFLMAMLILVLKVQSAVIKEEKTITIKKIKKPIKKPAMRNKKNNKNY